MRTRRPYEVQCEKSPIQRSLGVLRVLLEPIVSNQWLVIPWRVSTNGGAKRVRETITRRLELLTKARNTARFLNIKAFVHYFGAYRKIRIRKNINAASVLHRLHDDRKETFRPNLDSVA